MEEEEEEEAVSILSRKELRKQKFMEYLAAKGKLKPPNSKPYLRDNCQVKKHVATSLDGKENKTPADGITNGGAKTLVAQPTKHTAAAAAAARKTSGDSNKVSVKANVLIGRQNADRPAQPRLNRIPAPTGRSTVLSSRCDPANSAGRLEKQPNAWMPPPGRTHSNASRAAVTKPSGRFGSRAAGSCPPTPVSVRMSLGPMVKTKTGLIPAVTQPRNGPSQHLKPSSAAAEGPITSAAAAKKTQFSSLPPVSVSRKPAVTQRKPLPTASLNPHERLRAGIKVPNQSKSNNSKPPLSRKLQPSSKIPLSRGPKSTAAPFKPQGRAAAQPTDRFTKQRSDGGGKKNSQPCKAAPRASSGPASSRGSRAGGGGVPRPAAAAEPGGKPATRNTRGEPNGNKGLGSTKAPPTQTGMKRASAPGPSHAAPRPGRTTGRTGRPADAKTAKVSAGAVPPTEGKKLTAAQEERMRKLQQWREAKGISYKRPPMPEKPQVPRTGAAPQPFWGAMDKEDEAQSLISAVDRSLEDCIKLLREGCPPGPVREVLSRLPAVSKKFAKYWICQARLLEQEGHLDVLPMFEEAVGVVLEPVDELRVVVFEILKKRDEIHENRKEADRSPTCERTPESTADPTATPKPVRALLRGEKGDSSVVKYKITATPGGPPRQQTEPARVNGQEVRFFTPVRRSVRIERSSLRYPASLQDHDLCVSSYGDLIHEEEDGDEREAGGSSPMYVYRCNDALEDKVFVQLVYDDAV